MGILIWPEFPPWPIEHETEPHKPLPATDKTSQESGEPAPQQGPQLGVAEEPLRVRRQAAVTAALTPA
jgi:hypothetical protein